MQNSPTSFTLQLLCNYILWRTLYSSRQAGSTGSNHTEEDEDMAERMPRSQLYVGRKEGRKERVADAGEGKYNEVIEK